MADISVPRTVPSLFKGGTVGTENEDQAGCSFLTDRVRKQGEGRWGREGNREQYKVIWLSIWGQ